jgi:hypothetical protein
MNMLLAQSASLDAAMSTRTRDHRKVPIHCRCHCNRARRLAGTLGQCRYGQDVDSRGLLMALAVLIAEALFNAGGMPTIPIAP